MKLLVYDVELSDMDILIKSYDLKNRIRWFNHENIIRDWTMLGASWKHLDDDKISCVSISPKDPLNDYAVIQKLYKAIEASDGLIGHNADNFDLKKFNTRAIYYGMPPLQKKIQTDTLKIARKYFKFTSNSLRYIANYLGLENKGDSPDWDAVMSGDRKEIALMREYNRQDVIVTEQLYKKLRGWHHTHPDVSSVTRDIEGKEMDKCPSCDSVNVVKNGHKPKVKAGVVYKFAQVLLCRNCGRNFLR